MPYLVELIQKINLEVFLILEASRTSATGSLQGCLIESMYLGCQEVGNKLNQFPEKLLILKPLFRIFLICVRVAPFQYGLMMSKEYQGNFSKGESVNMKEKENFSNNLIC